MLPLKKQKTKHLRCKLKEAHSSHLHVGKFVATSTVYTQTARHNDRFSSVLPFVCTPLKCWFVKYANASVNPRGRLQVNSFVALKQPELDTIIIINT